MPQVTIYANNGGGIQSFNADYTQARNGTGTLNLMIYPAMGQTAGYFCYQGFLSFDTSSIPDGATVTAVTLRLYTQQNNTPTDFNVWASSFNWGASVATSDWRTPAQVGVLPTLATYNTASGWNPGFYISMASDTQFKSYINKTGTTYVHLCSDRWYNGSTPSGDEFVYATNYDATSGTRPYLDITYTLPEQLGQATIAGSASGTKTGTVTRLATSALAGAASLALTGQMTRLAAASLDGVSVLDSSAQMTRPAAAALDGTTALSAASGVTRLAAATLVNQVTISASATRDIHADAVLGGSSGLTATARLVTVLRPIADITNEGGDTGGSWVPSSGFDLWDMLNEDLTDDADYIESPSPVQQGEVELQLEPGSLPIGGVVTIVFRARTV